MDEATSQADAKPKRPRWQFGMRVLIGVVLMFGLLFGWLARMRRQALEQEALVDELARERVIVNAREPTLLCLVLTKLRGSRNILPETPAAFEKWLSPGWFSRVEGFNAGKLGDDKVPGVVARLNRLGDVYEVHFHGGSLDGLKLFYIGGIPYERLGPDQDTCTFTVYPASGAAPSSLPNGRR